MSTDPSQWIKASASGSNGNCVQLRQNAGVVELRDTKAQGEGPSLRISPAVFGAWLDGAKRGEFDHLR
jgi:hypothetical protein